MTIRTQLKAGVEGIRLGNHNEALRVRSTVKAGGASHQHNETLRVRSTVKAGGSDYQHNEALRVRSTVTAGGSSYQHNETLKRASVRPEISMRRQPLTASRKGDRLALMVVRAGLRVGRGARPCARW